MTIQHFFNWLNDPSTPSLLNYLEALGVMLTCGIIEVAIRAARFTYRWHFGDKKAKP